MSEGRPGAGGQGPATDAPACAELRTKTMFYGFKRAEALEVGPECASASFWCARTARPLGPDGEAASRSLCVPERDCFTR